MREVACESLKVASLLVAEAENGVQKLQTLVRFRADIILMDVLMPEMGGFATARAVRQPPGYEIMPVLIMTTLEDLESNNSAYEVGATDFITKLTNWMILVQRGRYIIHAVRVANEQKRLEKQLQQARKLEAVATLSGKIACDFNKLLQITQTSSELLLAKSREDSPD